jgi:hypothetical protein
MRGILGILLVLVPVLAVANAPDTLWTRTYGGENRDIAYSLQQTADGGYIMAGETYSLGAGGADFYLVKTDSTGDTLWTRTYGGSGSDGAREVQQTTDGGYIVAGTTGSFGAGSTDFYLVRTNSSGDTLWTRTYGGTYDESAYSVQQTSDGGYIIAGSRWGGTEFYVVKTDGAGNVTWTRTYWGSEWGSFARSVRQTTDGGYIVAGTTMASDMSLCFFVVRTNGQGDTLWTRAYGCGQASAYSVQQTADGGYIVGGATAFGEGWDSDLVKIDAQGDTLWTRTYDGLSGDDNWADDWAYSVQQTADGGYILAGETAPFPTDVRDMLLVRTDSDGDTLWTRTCGGGSDDGAYSVQQTADGGVIAAGYTYSFGAGNADCYLVKIGPEHSSAGMGNRGYVTLISPGPPDWGYQLHRTSGSLSRLVFTNFCSGTVGSVSGRAAAAGWTAVSYPDSIVFTTGTPFTVGAIETFWLSHPYCSDYVSWAAGDSSGTIEGPLPVELTTFEAIAGNEQVTLCWRTESELDNSHFVLYKRKAGEEVFGKLAEIPGHGTTTEPHDYEYVDRFVRNGLTYEYQISDVDLTGRETVHEQIALATPSAAIVPTEFALHAPYPNPFNPTTTIRYDVKETGLVSVRVFDLLGREVATLVHDIVPPGSYSVDWDATHLPSGFYLCQMETGEFMQVRKLVLLK